MSLLANSNAIESGGYNIDRSLRFRSSASASLSKTFGASPTSRTTMTYSAWVKRGAIGAGKCLFGTANNYESAYFQSDDTLYVCGPYMSAQQGNLTTTQVFRDPSAWYHIVIVYDTTNATATDRIKLYVNGSRVTSFSSSTNSNQNNTTTEWLVSGTGSRLGVTATVNYFDGYFAELNVIDGQALTPSSFGQTDTITGVWVPKKYTGTYGTNGFYLDFKDNTSATTLAYDKSGNSNNWTANNISTTAGATYDSMTDVPTLTSATAANYCTMNPLTNSSYTTLSGGNLNTSGNTSSDNGNTRSTFAVSSGKWYAEFTCTGVYSSSYPQYGIVTSTDANRPNNANPQGGGSSGLVNPTASVVYQPSGNKITSGSGSSYGSSWTTNDIIGIAVDSDNGAVYFSKNGVWQNSGVPTSGASKTGAALTWTGGAYEHVMCIAEYNGSGTATNFGQRPFSYTPPTGFVALNTFNLPDPTIKKPNQYMDATLYTGTDGVAGSVVNAAGFQPDLVWAKSRASAGNHVLADSVRGVNKTLYSNATAAEVSNATELTSFNSNGFSYGTSGDWSAGTHVGWQWKESATAGFDIVTYTGTGSARTISHNLGVAPKMIFVKARSTTGEWDTYHASLPSASYYLVLNATDAQATSSGVWNATAPTSSVFSVGTSGSTNGNGTTFVAYLFAEIPQFSKAFSYTGNGSADGPMVHLGFRPKWIMVKSSSTGGAGYNWVLYDTSRSPYNVADLQLAANLSDAEAVSNQVDLLSNGFKVFGGGTRMNGSGTTYIGMAFAEFPFKFSLAR